MLHICNAECPKLALLDEDESFRFMSKTYLISLVTCEKEKMSEMFN